MIDEILRVVDRELLNLRVSKENNTDNYQKSLDRLGQLYADVKAERDIAIEEQSVLQVEVNHMKHALAFYALLGNWQGCKDGFESSQCERDMGNIARAAIGRVNNGTPGAVRPVIEP